MTEMKAKTPVELQDDRGEPSENIANRERPQLKHGKWYSVAFSYHQEL